MLKQILGRQILWGSALLFLLGGCTLLFQIEDLDSPPAHIKPLNLREIPVAFSHIWDDDHSFHLAGAAAIDIDNDGRFEIFVGGGRGQDDALLTFENNKLVNKIKGTGLSSRDATYGALAIDIDNDQDVDLIVSRDKGVTIYLAEGKEKFRPYPLKLNLPKNTVPLGITPIDIERDGDIDLYISLFIDSEHFKSVTYNDPSHRRDNILLRNELLRNDGNLKFTDITDQQTRGKQNTFTAASADLNRDGLADLILAHNTAQVEMLQNKGGQKFKAMDLKTGFGFWMGIGLGDVDNDGDVDLLFSNSGSSIPAWILQGDLKDGQNFNPQWALMRNDGNFNFTDITRQTGLAEVGFGWGAVFEDLNYDGALDMLGSQTYVNWPVHWLFKLPSKIMLNDPKKLPTFYAANTDTGKNFYYSHSPLLSDINKDGRTDLIWINANGPVRAFLNLTQGNYISIHVPDGVLSLGAVITVEAGGQSYKRQITSAQGLTVDQPPVFLFGLNEATSVKQVKVRWSNGRVTQKKNPPINQILFMQP